MIVTPDERRWALQARLDAESPSVAERARLSRELEAEIAAEEARVAEVQAAHDRKMGRRR